MLIHHIRDAVQTTLDVWGMALFEGYGRSYFGYDVDTLDIREVGRMETTLGRWGNSNAVRVPAEACEELGIQPGSRAEIDVDPRNSVLILKFKGGGKRYARSRRMSMEEFAAGWDGGKVGEEWGGPDVGKEAVR